MSKRRLADSPPAAKPDEPPQPPEPPAETATLQEILDDLESAQDRNDKRIEWLLKVVEKVQDYLPSKLDLPPKPE